MSRRTYPNPPIIEAVVEFRFPATPANVVETLRQRLQAVYEEVHTQDRIEAQLAFDAQSVMTSTRRSPHRTILKSALGTRMLTCANEALGVHVLRPYPGWENFIEQISEAVEALPSEVHLGRLDSIGVRYVNHMVFEMPADGLLVYEQYINVIPPRVGEAMPDGLIDHQALTRAVDVETRTSVELRSVILSGPPAQWTLDILVHRHLDRPFDEWKSVLEALHEQGGRIFEDCITDDTRRLFQ